MLASRVSKDFLRKVPIRQVLSRSRPFLPLASSGMKWTPHMLQSAKPFAAIERKNFSSNTIKQNPNVLQIVEAGKFEGILNSTADEVFHTLSDFYNLKWTGLDLKVEQVKGFQNLGDIKFTQAQKAQLKLKFKDNWCKIPVMKMRSVTYPREGAQEINLQDILLPPVEQNPLQLNYIVNINRLKFLDANLTKPLKNSLVIVTQTLEDLGDLGSRQCRYTMRTQVTAPYTITKLLNAPLDKLNGIYFKGLFKLFNWEDLDIDINKIPLTLTKVVDFLDFQMHNARGEAPVELVKRENGALVAGTMPNADYGLRHEKLVKLASIIAAIPIEKLYNTFVNDATTATMGAIALEQDKIPTPPDPWFSMFRLQEQKKKDLDPDRQFRSNDIYGQKLPNFITKNQNYLKDEVFCEYFFNGGNPFNVRKAHFSDQTQKQITVPHFADFKDNLPDEDLEQLVKEGKLYYLDYSMLEKVKYPVVFNNMLQHAPTVLLQKDGSKYKLLAIYVEAKFQGKKEPKKRVFTRKDKQEVWRLAKMHVHVSDLIFYQIFVHLGTAHLMSEPLAVAVYNSFIAQLRHIKDQKKKCKPSILGTVLGPYAHGLLGINHLGLITIVDEQLALIDSVFAGGSEALLQASKTYLQKNYSLNNMDPNVDLKNRGFAPEDAKSKDFGYAYYSTQLFKIIKDYMRDVVTTQYNNDQEVQADADMKILRKDLEHFQLGMQLNTIEGLVQFAACHMWTLTAFHSISFSIQDYDAYIPFRFSGLTKPLPLDKTLDHTIDKTYVIESLPFPSKQLVNQVLLGAVGTRMETTLLETKNPFTKQDHPEFFKHYQNFHNKLQKFEDEYEKDMEELKKKGKMQFYYLKPSFIENCLAI